MKRHSFLTSLLLLSLLLSISASAAVTPSSEMKAENCQTIASCRYPGDASFAITNDGSLWAWGLNYHASVGNGTKAPVETPVKVLSNAVSIKAGSSGAIALCADGSVYTWGTFQDTPTKMLENAVDIFINRGSAGSGDLSDTFFALKADGTLWGWGGNNYGQIGNCKAIITTVGESWILSGEFGRFITEPSLVMSDVKTMVDPDKSYSSITAVIKTDNTLWGWGDNRSGILDFGKKSYDNCWDCGFKVVIAGATVDGSDISSEAQIDHNIYYKAPCLIMENVRDARFLEDAGFVIKPDNTLWGWGDNSEYTLGVDNPSSFLPLTYITDNVLSYPPYAYYTFTPDRAIIKRDHTVWFWGYNWGSGPRYYKTPVCIGTEAASADAVECGFYRLYKDGSLYDVDSFNYYEVGTHYVNGKYSIDEGGYERETLVLTNVRFPGQKILTPGTFQDVFTDDIYYDAVEWIAANGITAGTGPNTFSPAASCTRGQVVTFLWRAMGKPEPVTEKNPFADIKPEDYYYAPILWAVEQGITLGTSENRFDAEVQCSHAQILTFLWRAMGKPDNTDAALWYEDAFNWAEHNDLLNDTSAVSAPAASCPRSSVALFLFRTLAK